MNSRNNANQSSWVSEIFKATASEWSVSNVFNAFFVSFVPYVSCSDAKHSNGELVYLARFADTGEPEEILASEANLFWPQRVIDFFLMRLEWVQPNNSVGTIPSTESLDVDLDVKPERVLCKLANEIANYFRRFQPNFNLTRCNIIQRWTTFLDGVGTYRPKRCWFLPFCWRKNSTQGMARPYDSLLWKSHFIRLIPLKYIQWNQFNFQT